LGTILAEGRGRDGHALIVCRTTAALGDAEGIGSPSSDMGLSNALTREFSLDKDHLKALKSNVRYRSVKNISFSLTNVDLKKLSLDAAEQGARMRSHSCWQAMEYADSLGLELTMVSATLKADVVFNVEYEKDFLLSPQQEAAAESLATNLGFTGVHLKSVSNNKITGQGLYWGIQDDQFLLRVDSAGVPDYKYVTRMKSSRGGNGSGSSGPIYECDPPPAKCPRRGLPISGSGSSTSTTEQHEPIRLLPSKPILQSGDSLPT
jgi:hypothetical protein